MGSCPCIDPSFPVRGVSAMGVGLSSSASAHHGPSIIVGLDGVESGYDSRGGSSVRGGGGGGGVPAWL